jgi:hypothetical protein
MWRGLLCHCLLGKRLPCRTSRTRRVEVDGLCWRWVDRKNGGRISKWRRSTESRNVEKQSVSLHSSLFCECIVLNSFRLYICEDENVFSVCVCLCMFKFIWFSAVMTKNKLPHLILTEMRNTKKSPESSSFFWALYLFIFENVNENRKIWERNENENENENGIDYSNCLDDLSLVCKSINFRMYEVTLPKSEKCHFCVFLSQEKEETPRLLGTADYKIVPYNIHIGFYIFDRSTNYIILYYILWYMNSYFICLLLLLLCDSMILWLHVCTFVWIAVSKLIDQTDKWINSRDIYKHFTLDTSQRNHIVIVPCTFKPGQESPFRLRVYADDTLSIRPKWML